MGHTRGEEEASLRKTVQMKTKKLLTDRNSYASMALKLVNDRDSVRCVSSSCPLVSSPRFRHE